MYDHMCYFLFCRVWLTALTTVASAVTTVASAVTTAASAVTTVASVATLAGLPIRLKSLSVMSRALVTRAGQSAAVLMFPAGQQVDSPMTVQRLPPVEIAI